MYTKEINKIKEEIIQKSFTKDKICHKFINMREYDVIICYQGITSYRSDQGDTYSYGMDYDYEKVNAKKNKVEVYDVMVVNLMTMYVDSAKSFTITCINDFIGEKIGIVSNYKYDNFYMDNNWGIKTFKKGFHITTTYNEEKTCFKNIYISYTDNNNQSLIFKLVNDETKGAFYPISLQGYICFNGMYKGLSKEDTKKILNQVKHTSWGAKLNEYFMALCKPFNHMTEQDLKILKRIFKNDFLNKLMTPKFANEYVEIVQRKPTVSTDKKHIHYDVDNVIGIKGNCPKEYDACLGHLLHILKYGKQERNSNYRYYKFKDFDVVLGVKDFDDFNSVDHILYVNTPFGYVDTSKGHYMSNGFLKEQRDKFFEYFDKKIPAMMKLTGKTFRELIKNKEVSYEEI